MMLQVADYMTVPLTVLAHVAPAQRSLDHEQRRLTVPLGTGERAGNESSRSLA